MGKANNSNQTDQCFYEDFLSASSTASNSASGSVCNCSASNSQILNKTGKTRHSREADNNQFICQKCCLCKKRNTPCLCCVLNDSYPEGFSLIPTNEEKNNCADLECTRQFKSKKRQRIHRTNSSVSNKRRKLAPNVIEDCFFDSSEESSGYINNDERGSSDDEQEDGIALKKCAEFKSYLSKPKKANLEKAGCSYFGKTTKQKAVNTSRCSLFDPTDLGNHSPCQRKHVTEDKHDNPWKTNLPNGKMDNPLIQNCSNNFSSAVPTQHPINPSGLNNGFPQAVRNDSPSFIGTFSMETSTTVSPCTAEGYVSTAEEVTNTVMESNIQTSNKNNPVHNTTRISTADEVIVCTTERNNASNNNVFMGDIISRYVADEIAISTLEYNSCDQITSASQGQAFRSTEASKSPVGFQEGMNKEIQYGNTFRVAAPSEVNRNPTLVNPTAQMKASECINQSNILQSPTNCPCHNETFDQCCHSQNVTNIVPCQNIPCAARDGTKSSIPSPVFPGGIQPCLNSCLNQCLMNLISQYNVTNSDRTPAVCSLGCQTHISCKESCIQTADLTPRLHSATQYSKTQVPNLICQCTQTQIKNQDTGCKYFVPKISNFKLPKQNAIAKCPLSKPTAVFTCSSSPDVRLFEAQLVCPSSRPFQRTMDHVITEKVEEMRTVTSALHENSLSREPCKFNFRPICHDKFIQVSARKPLVSDLVLDYLKITLLFSLFFLLINFYGNMLLDVACCHFAPAILFVALLFVVLHFSDPEALEKKCCPPRQPVKEVAVWCRTTRTATHSGNCTDDTISSKGSRCFTVPPYPQKTALKDHLTSRNAANRIPRFCSASSECLPRQT